ncbi:Fe-Mn family superoxide dismutase [Paraburkholderia sp. HP33-1]|uniref:Fe-Mn family superoxide dismutase n=1 Tax=Paraburkholderia sp. HP33-1 TaxID=2883243 RepID=UPI001F2EDB3D|nr:Fe-Mn family superoxide dismutase [Paraburkholderia sp. HP33-1]
MRYPSRRREPRLSQPILVLDLFEHTYYLKYQHRHNEHVNQLFSIINWDNAAMSLQEAMPSRASA